jgi:outer membrane protein OmpA-like peptidoglycan-associated protein
MSNDTGLHSEHYPIYEHPYPLTELTLRRHNGYPYVIEPSTTLDVATAGAATLTAASAAIQSAAHASSPAVRATDNAGPVPSAHHKAETQPATQAGAHRAAESRPALDVTPIKADVSRTVAPVHTTTHSTAVKQEARPEARAGHSAPAAAAPARPAARRDDETDRRGGGPWLGWVTVLGTVFALSAAFFLTNRDAVKDVAKTETATATSDAKTVVVAESTTKKTVDAVAPEAEAKVEAKVEPKAETPAPVAPEAPAAKEAAPAAPPAAGITLYNGIGDGKAMAWSAEATLNPDYAETAAAEPAEPEAQAGDAEGGASAVETAAAAPEAAPVALGGVGVTSFYGGSQSPDREQAWAAEAEMNDDYEAADAAPEAVAEAAPAAAPEVAPVSLGGVGLTSYYGEGQTPDAGKPWSAEASMNPDYTAEAPAPAAVAAVEAPAPVSLGGVGVTSYYGEGQTPDAGHPWSADASMNPDYTAAAPAPAPAAAPAAEAPPPVSLGGVGVTSLYAGSTWTAPANTYAAVEPAPAAKVADPCNDAVAAALKSGKLNFAISSWEILDDSYPTLDKIAKLIKGCSGAAVEVGGHTDNTGLRDSNQVLSEQRAKAVVRYLTGAGVAPTQLKAMGYGQDKPIADNATVAGKRENRRIEFVVSGK